MKYRHAWPGVLLLSALAVLLASLLIWGDHFLTPSPAGGIRGLLEVRLLPVQLLPGSGRETPSPAETPRARVETGTPAGGDLVTSSPASDTYDLSAGTRHAAADGVERSVGPSTPAPSTALSPHRARYALALGNFAVEEDAERAEAQLNQVGISTVRFRQQSPERRFSVAIRRLDGDTETTVGLDGATANELIPPAASAAEGSAPLWVAKALSLSDAVALAERLKASGYDARIAAEARKAGPITLRHGNFISRQEAEAASRQIAQLGVANEVVKVK